MTLKEYMYERRLTIKQMAKLIQVHPSYLGKILRGVARSSPKLAYFIQYMTGGIVKAEKILGYQLKL